MLYEIASPSGSVAPEQTSSIWSKKLPPFVHGSHYPLGPGTGYELNVPTYHILDDALQGSTLLEFCGDVGIPPTETVIILSTGNGLTPTQNSGAVEILEATFRRGDVNTSGFVTIEDALVLLGYLFLTEAIPTCLDACDINDDGVLNLADPVGLLAHLYLPGSPPVPPPSPDACGTDAAPDGFPACVYPLCP